MNTDRKIVGVHLDLKYHMPNKQYLEEWIARLPEFGINTLLLEYEDKFPFQKYPFLQDPSAFTPTELRSFLAHARAAGLQIVPLVQSLSHLEFALAHPQLEALRELPDTPTQICPSNPDAVAFVCDLYDEVLAYHDEDEWFHLGADEAWALGKCEKCAPRCADGHLPLWLEHTKKMCAYVRDRGKTPFVWDDTLWNTPEAVSQLPEDVIIGTWHYHITELNKDKNPWRCTEVYREAGRRVVTIPCMNWGVLFPQHMTFDNTAALAELSQKLDCEGLINSAWSCFHLPLPTFFMQLAATGAMMGGQTVDNKWEEQFLAAEFGTAADGVPAALASLGELWELSIEGSELGRPITPPMHGCMDMVLYFEGQQARARNGAYPLDWMTIDFNELYQQKLAMMKGLADDRVLQADIADHLTRYPDAVARLRKFADSAKTHIPEAKLMAALATFKFEAVKALDHQINGGSNGEELKARTEACYQELAAALSPFLEPPSVDRLLRMWVEPIRAALAA